MVAARRSRAFALVLAGGLVAAACGSDSERAADTTQAGAVTAPAGASTDAFGPSAANPKLILGPEGFEIDTSKCPSGWSDTEGVSPTEIKLAHSMPFSGTYAVTGGISRGMQAYFDHVNKTEGGVGGRKLSLVSKDDAYEAARLKSNVDEILGSVRPLAIPALAGTPGNLAVYDTLNERCVPHLLAATGHNAFSDPENHPWSTPSYLSYATEGSIWAQYAGETVGRGATVARLVVNNDFGQAYQASFEKKAKELGLNIVATQLQDPAAPTVTNEMTTLAASNADVLALMVGGTPCTQAVQWLAESAWKPKAVVTGCTAQNFTAAGPSAAIGNYFTTQYRKDTSDAVTYANDPDALKIREMLKASSFDTNDYSNHWGVWFAMPFVDMLQKASARPGGLSRTNLMITARSQKYEHPTNLGEGASRIKWEMNGLKDVAFTEGAQMAKWTVGADGKGGWKVFGNVIEQNGQTPICVWNGKSCG